MYMKHIGSLLRIPLWALFLCMGVQSFAALRQAPGPRQAPGKISKAQAWMTRAYDAYHTESYALAYRCFTKAANKDPRNDAARYALAKMDRTVEGPAAALKRLHQALEIDPENYWYRRMEAQLYEEQGQMDRAIQLYEALAADRPGKTELLYELTNLYLKTDQKDKALSTLDKLDRLQGPSEQGVLTRLSLYIEQEDSLQTAALMESAARELPSPRILTLVGDYQMARGHQAPGADSLALDAYQRALALDSDYVPAHMGLAEVYRMRSQFDLYFEHINRFLGSSVVELPMKVNYMRQLLGIDRFVATFLPQVDTMFLNMDRVHARDTAFAYFYSTFLAQSDRIGETQKILVRNVAQHPTDPHAHNRLLGVHYFLKDWDALCLHGKEAVARFPLDRAASPDSADWAERKTMHTLLAVALQMRKDNAASLEIFRALLKSTDKEEVEEQISLHSSIGDIYYEMGRKEEAYAQYDRVLQLDPHSVPTLNNYAYYLSLDGKELEKALKMSAYTLEQEPLNGTYLDTYGWILYLMGRYTEAKDVLRKAVAYGGNESAEVLNHYGDVLWALGEKALALVKWNQALAVDAQREDIRQKVAKASRL